MIWELLWQKPKLARAERQLADDDASRKANAALQAAIAPIFDELRAKFEAMGGKLSSIRIEDGEVLCAVIVPLRAYPPNRPADGQPAPPQG
jgi:hypothetical protein